MVNGTEVEPDKVAHVNDDENLLDNKAEVDARLEKIIDIECDTNRILPFPLHVNTKI